MVFNTQNYWIFRLYPLFGIAKTKITQRFGHWRYFRPQERSEGDLLCRVR